MLRSIRQSLLKTLHNIGEINLNDRETLTEASVEFFMDTLMLEASTINKDDALALMDIFLDCDNAKEKEKGCA